MNPNSQAPRHAAHSQSTRSGAHNPQTSRQAGERRLTPAQRQRILRERRRRQQRHQLFAALGVLAALVVILVVVLVNLGHQRAEMHRALTLPENSEGVVQAMAQTALPEATDAPAAVPAAATDLPMATEPPAPAATDAPVIPDAASNPPASAPTTQTSPVYDSSAPFVYEEAYAAAVLGADTGAPVTPDYSTVDPAKLDRWPEVNTGFMPMVSKANTDENIIAVTVDDCFQADNLKQIVACALNNNAKLTIFPIGENLERDSVAEVIRAAWERGMEIENHTYTHKGTYHYDDNYMTEDIWRQSVVLNQVLGVNYRQHFFRPKGGDERFDQRTHAYVRQLGFSALALWTQSGSTDSMESLLKNRGPGRIYLFHTTDNDLSKLLQFIPEAVNRGYRLVTLNEMFGLPDNETSDLSTAPAEKPALQSFHVLPMTLKLTSYARAAAAVQARLIELGWMKGEPTGVYGKTTHACMELFQAAAGLNVDGTAGEESQKLLFSDGAPTGGDQRIRELAQQMDADVQAAIREMFAQ